MASTLTEDEFDDMLSSLGFKLNPPGDSMTINEMMVLTIERTQGWVHPEAPVLQDPSPWVPCVFRWTWMGQITDYLLSTREDLHRMCLWILDFMVVNLHAPSIIEDYDAPREHWTGWFSPADHDDVIHDIDHARFQAIRRAKHGPLAWWWLQRHYRTAGGTIEFVASHPGAVPVPTDPPPSTIIWIDRP